MRLTKPRVLRALGVCLLITLAQLQSTPPASAYAPESGVSRSNNAATPALAENPTINVLVALAPIDRTTATELVALTVDAQIGESEGHTTVRGNSTFKVHNTDKVNPLNLTVGFPEWAGGALSFNPAKFTEFSVSLGNKNVTPAPTTAPVKIGKETRPVTWYAFDLKLDPDEKQLVRVDFVQDLGTGTFPRFTYGLLPSSGWKGLIGSVRMTVRLPTETVGDQFIALDPTLPKFDGQNLTWLWTDLDPTVDPGLTFIRPSLWDDLVSRRGAVSRTPDNPNARLGLARIYQQLSSEDTPRRDNFLAQAIAELETAARLDPKNVEAVTTLAQLYETRAGAPSGPRDPNYVSLALLQWQNLIGTSADGDAREHAAEDSFYLGIDARSRGQNDTAVQFLDQAAKLAPQGAGPLYTTEHWRTEAQAAHAALARTYAQEDQFELAMSHARSAFGDDFNIEPAPASPAFALDRASITTANYHRRVTVYLLAYPNPSEEARQAVASVVADLTETGAAAVSLGASETGYSISIDIPFNEDRDLQNKVTHLAKAFPRRADWALISTALGSGAVELSEEIDTFTRRLHYKEEIDLKTPLSQLQSNMNELSQSIGRLEKASPDDNLLQVKLALLRDAQRWWQRALASADLSYELQPRQGSVRHWDIKPGQKTTLSVEEESIRTQWYFIGAGIGLVTFILLLILFSLIRKLRKRRAPRPSA